MAQDDTSITPDAWRWMPNLGAIEAILEEPSLIDRLDADEIKLHVRSPLQNPGQSLALWLTLAHHAPDRFPEARSAIRQLVAVFARIVHAFPSGEWFSRWLAAHPGTLAPLITRLECAMLMRPMRPIQRMGILLEVWNTPMRRESREHVSPEDWRHSRWRGLLAEDYNLQEALKGAPYSPAHTRLPHLMDLTLAYPDTMAALVGGDMEAMLTHHARDYVFRFASGDARIALVEKMRAVLAPRFGRNWEGPITQAILKSALDVPGWLGDEHVTLLEETLVSWREKSERPAIMSDDWADLYASTNAQQRLLMMLHADAVHMMPSAIPEPTAIPATPKR